MSSEMGQIVHLKIEKTNEVELCDLAAPPGEGRSRLFLLIRLPRRTAAALSRYQLSTHTAQDHTERVHTRNTPLYSPDTYNAPAG